MYFWDISGLKKALVKNELSENAKFAYIFVFFAAVTIVGNTSYLASHWVPIPEITQSDFWYSGLNVAIIIAGIFLVYKVNGGAAGRHFSDRFFSLGFVSTIRILVFALPFFIATALLETAIGAGKFGLAHSNTIISLAVTLVTYLYIAKHTRDVAANSASDKLASSAKPPQNSSEFAAQG